MTNSLIEASGIDVTLGGRQILNGLSIDIREGEVLLVIGHNGSGKSTLLHALTGLVPVRAERLYFSKGNQLGTGIGLLQQHRNLFLQKTVLQNVAAGTFGRFSISQEEEDKLAEIITSKFKILDGFLQQPCEELSGGVRQLAALLRVVMSPAPLLLLDEPSIGIAPYLHHAVFDEIRKAANFGRGAIIVEHNLAAAGRVADRLVVIRNGKISYSGNLEILNDTQALRDVYL